MTNKVPTIKTKLRKTLAPFARRLMQLFSEQSIRPAIQFVRSEMKSLDLVGLEIGVYHGDNAKSMLMNLPIKKLYLIDSYELKKIGERRNQTEHSYISCSYAQTRP